MFLGVSFTKAGGALCAAGDDYVDGVAGVLPRLLGEFVFVDATAVGDDDFHWTPRAGGGHEGVGSTRSWATLLGPRPGRPIRWTSEELPGFKWLVSGRLLVCAAAVSCGIDRIYLGTRHLRSRLAFAKAFRICWLGSHLRRRVAFAGTLRICGDVWHLRRRLAFATRLGICRTTRHLRARAIHCAGENCRRAVRCQTRPLHVVEVVLYCRKGAASARRAYEPATLTKGQQRIS